jgi:endonuclease YncB( thermonuclease family)
MRRRRPNRNKIAYPKGRSRPGRFRQYLPNAREVRHAIGCAVVLVALWWLWELLGIGPTLFTNPANWTIWDSGQSASAASTGSLAGQATVIDGDTIEIHGERIRLLDIDAPEARQTCIHDDGTVWRCGQQSALELSDWIDGRPVTCRSEKLDKYGRHLANCSVGGDNLSQWLAINGWAVPYRDCGCEVVRAASWGAELAKRGIWSGTFQMPWEWRKAN